MPVRCRRRGPVDVAALVLSTGVPDLVREVDCAKDPAYVEFCPRCRLSAADVDREDAAWDATDEPGVEAESIQRVADEA